MSRYKFKVGDRVRVQYTGYHYFGIIKKVSNSYDNPYSKESYWISANRSEQQFKTYEDNISYNVQWYREQRLKQILE